MMNDESGNGFEWVTPRRNAVDEAIGLTEDPRPARAPRDGAGDNGASDGNPIDDPTSRTKPVSPDRAEPGTTASPPMPPSGAVQVR
jgi:hypothetical protein